MRTLFVIATLLTHQAFAGGIFFHPEYSGTFHGDPLILQLQTNGTDYAAKVTHVPHHETLAGTMHYVSFGKLESVYEIKLDGQQQPLKIVTNPPCTEANTLTLILPSGAQVLMTKN